MTTKRNHKVKRDQPKSRRLAGTGALARVATLDLARFGPKLMWKLGWTAEVCAQVEDRYRKYLALLLLYPRKGIFPTGPIDEFWHAHILDTVAYHRDCRRLFGYYRHHPPSSMDHGKQLSLAVTLRLFRQHFGIEPWTELDRVAPPTTSRPSRARRSTRRQGHATIHEQRDTSNAARHRRSTALRAEWAQPGALAAAVTTASRGKQL